MIENECYGSAAENYLFGEIAGKVAAFKAEHESADVISLGIGDVSLPLPACAVTAMRKAAKETGKRATFRGYAPTRGYDFLTRAIADFYAREMGVLIDEKNVFVSDGAKNDAAAIPEIFGYDRIIVPDPAYPVYADAALLSGKKAVKVRRTAQNGFEFLPDCVDETPSLVYLCSPDNPTGLALSGKTLSAWVEHALKTNSVIVFDGAYERFMQSDEPRSIFEIEGADACAVEIGSLSKSAGFTGTRCSWLVVGEKMPRARSLWARRQATKFNGVPYVVQRAAESVLSEKGTAECEKLIEYYRRNVKIITSALFEAGLKYYGGKDSPYVFLACPLGMTSNECFEFFLSKLNVVVTPGSGFGEGGEGFVRLSALCTREAAEKFALRLRKVFSRAQ